MPVNTTHAEYNKFSKEWRKCRDAYEGEMAIKAGNDLYLPRVNSHWNGKDEGDINYKSRASYLNAMRRTVQGLHGLLFRVDPIMPEDMDVGHAYDLSRWVSEEVLVAGRCGVLVDGDE